MRGAHLSQHLIQPLQGAVQVNLNPAGCAGHILAVVLCTPALNKAHADSAHLGELINGLKAVVDRLSQQLSELLVVENL